MARPFLVIGAMKSGTTSLHVLLDRHPDVDLVAEKESSALADPAAAQAFADRVAQSPATVAGEVTAGYMQVPEMPQPLDAARDLLGPELKVVAILRDPFGRAISHCEHLTQLGRETRDAATAILDPDGPYVAFSRYHHQVSGWVDLVGRDNVLLLRTEDLQADQAATADRLHSFLGVAATGDATPVHANAGATRAVASGWRSRVSRSPAYRRFVRPLLGAGARRTALRLSGGGRGRVAGALTDAQQQTLRDLLAPDLAALQRAWPELGWS